VRRDEKDAKDTHTGCATRTSYEICQRL